MEEPLVSKHALVTGASRGFGRAICEVLKLRGYSVSGVGSRPAPTAMDWIDSYISIDLSSHDLGTRLGEVITPDVLVNAAGIYIDDPRRWDGKVMSLGIGHVRKTFDVNFFAALELALRFLPGMLKSGHGRIVNVSSGMGRMSEFDGVAFAYRASKLCLNAATLALASALDGPQDVSVFSFCPGWIRTAMGTDDAPDRPEEAAQALVQLLDLPREQTLGCFFRKRQKLDWWEKRTVPV
jgi:NAD(P)-dependent dehydrogenase (short-subunit alcohol dehydrogenase family)